MPDNLSRLRRNSNYPTYRTAVGILTVAGYLIASGAVAAGFIFISQEPLVSVLCFFGAALVILLTHLVRDICLMAADAADALIDLAAPADSESPAAAEFDSET